MTSQLHESSKELVNCLIQGCQTRGLLGAILLVGNRAEGRMMFFDLEITTSPGNDLCNVAHSEIDLKKKRSLPPQHLHTIVLLQASLIRNRVLWHEVELISKYKKSLCTSQVSPVLGDSNVNSNVSSKMKRCKTAKIH